MSTLFDSIKSGMPKAEKKAPAVTIANLEACETIEDLRGQLGEVAKNHEYVTFKGVATACGRTEKYRPDVTGVVLAAVGAQFECLVVDEKGQHHHKIAEVHAGALKELGYAKFPKVKGAPKVEEDTRETI